MKYKTVGQITGMIFFLMIVVFLNSCQLPHNNFSNLSSPDPSEFVSTSKIIGEYKRYFINDEPKAVRDEKFCYGYMATDGTWIIEPQYSYAQNFVNGYALVGNRELISAEDISQGSSLELRLINDKNEDVLGEPVDQKIKNAIYLLTQASDLKTRYKEIKQWLENHPEVVRLSYVGENLYQVDQKNINESTNTSFDNSSYIMDEQFQKCFELGNVLYDEYIIFENGTAVNKHLSFELGSINLSPSLSSVKNPLITREGKRLGGDVVCLQSEFSFGELAIMDRSYQFKTINTTGDVVLEFDEPLSKLMKISEDRYLICQNGEFKIVNNRKELLVNTGLADGLVNFYITKNASYISISNSEGYFLLDQSGNIIATDKDELSMLSPKLYQCSNSINPAPQYIKAVSNNSIIYTCEESDDLSYKQADLNVPVDALISHDFGADIDEFPYYRDWGDVMDYTEECSYPNGIYPMVNEDGKWGYVDDALSWVIKPQFDSASQFSQGFACVSIKNEHSKDSDATPNFKTYLIDEEGNKALDGSISGIIPWNILTNNPHKTPQEQYECVKKLYQKYPGINLFYYAGSNIFGIGVNYDSMECRGMIGYINNDFEEVIPLHANGGMLFFDKGVAADLKYFNDEPVYTYVTNKGYELSKEQVVDYLGSDNSKREEIPEQFRGLRKIHNLTYLSGAPFLIGPYRQLSDNTYYQSYVPTDRDSEDNSYIVVNAEGKRVDCDFNKTREIPIKAYRINDSVRLSERYFTFYGNGHDKTDVFDEHGKKLFELPSSNELRYLAPNRWLVYGRDGDWHPIDYKVINEQGQLLYKVNM